MGARRYGISLRVFHGFSQGWKSFFKTVVYMIIKFISQDS